MMVSSSRRESLGQRPDHRLTEERMQEHVYDVVVLGTGAAGLTAALRAAAAGAQVGLFEKADTVGGTSAWSGGTVWLPNNRHEMELGFRDSREEALTYLMSLSHDLMEQPLVEAYVDTAPEVAAWLEDNSPVEFETLRGMSDYHPEHPGGNRRAGRWSARCPLRRPRRLGPPGHCRLADYRRDHHERIVARAEGT
jgi:3-oxosteroid 1-dehydrogenase